MVGACPKGKTSVIVMEHLEGPSFRGWLAAERRSWRDILAVVVQAARGLSAAHACGLLHGDLSLNNVVITDAGVAKLIDFGLAQPQREAEAGQPAWAPRIVLAQSCGTPGYTAPEQLAPGTVDARTDLFSLCVVAWEALCGRLPYPSAALSPATVPSVRPPPPDLAAWPRAAPAWLRDLLLRGLRLECEERPVSVQAFLAEIERRMAPLPRWLPWAAAAALVAMAVGGTVWAMQPALPGPLAQGAQGLAMPAAEELAALEQRAPGLPERIVQFRRVWDEARDAARGFADAGLRERAAECLARRQGEYEAVLTAVADTPEASRDVTARWFDELAPPEVCGDPTATAQGGAAGPDPEHARGVALLLRGDLAEARRAFEAARARATDPRMRGQANRRLAEIAIQTGDFVAAERLLRVAAREVASDDLLALYVAKQQAHVAIRRDDPREALTLYRVAAARHRNLRGPGVSENAADLAQQAAFALYLLHERGEEVACPIDCDACDALTCAARMIADTESVTPGGPGSRARLHFYRAVLARASGDREAAGREILAARGLDGDPERPSPDTFAVLQFAADLAREAGRSDEAVAGLRQALRALVVRGLGRSPQVLKVYVRLAHLLEEQAIRQVGQEALPILQDQGLDPVFVPAALELYQLVATAWIEGQPPELAEGLVYAEGGVALAERHRGRLDPRTRIHGADLLRLSALAMAGSRPDAARDRMREGLEWLPRQGDLADPELRSYAAMVGEALQELVEKTSGNVISE